jgi:glycosyltransferase involved in cell wall biosynthesis
MSDRPTLLWVINKPPRAAGGTLGQTIGGGWLDAYIDLVAGTAQYALTVLFPDRADEGRSFTADGVDYAAFPTGEVGSRVGRVSRRWLNEPTSAASLAAIASVAGRVRPDLIHLHGAEYGYGLPLLRGDAPVLVSVQGSPSVVAELWTRGIDTHYRAAESISDLARGTGSWHSHRTMLARAATEATIMAAVQGVAGRTEWDRRFCSVMAPEATYFHIDEPLRPEFYEASRSRAGVCAGRIVTVAPDYPRKGVGTLLRALDLIVRSGHDVELVVVGMAPGSVSERATRDHAHALGLDQRVRSVGTLDAQGLIDQLQAASLFVTASHWENSSNAVSEAMVLGVPTVASAAGGLPTLADDGRAALLFQDGDAVALAGAVGGLLGDPASAEELGRRGRAHAEARLDRGCILGQLQAAYSSLLGQRLP